MSQEINIPGFKLLDKIGEGARGTVYRAHQLSLDRLVAVKILGSTLATDAEYTANFVQEARAVAKLSHPNIVQAIEAGNHEGVWFFVMELVEGGSLLARLEQSGPMPEREAIEVAMQVAQALNFAWSEAGLIHRDIKPANILVTPHGQAKLADLGLAMKRGSQQEAKGYVEGTPQYCAPEQCRGDPNLDTRTDLYALGATLYHLVCGRPPFDGDDPAKVMTLQITNPVESPRLLNPNLTPEFEAMILKLLAKDPADRFQSPTELMEKIQQMRAPQPEPQPEPQPTAKPLDPVAAVTLAPQRTWLRVGRAVLVGGGLMLVLAAAAVAVLRPEWVRSQWGDASKVQGAFQQMANTVARLTRTLPWPGRTASPASPAVQPLPAASTQTASAGSSQETMFQRVLNGLRRIRFTQRSATSPTPQASQTNAISRLVDTPSTTGSRSPQKTPVPPPAPAAAAPALLVAKLTPPPAQPAPPVQAAPAPTPTPASQGAKPTTPVQPAPAPSAPSPAPPAVQPPATKQVVASLKAPDAPSTSAVKQIVVQRAKLAPMPQLPEITSRNVPISMMVQRFFRRKQTAVDAAQIPIYGEARNYYLETLSLRITLQNLSAQTITNVTVRWVVAKRPVTRDLTAKNVFLGAEEKLVFNPIERKVIETTPIEVGGVMSSFVGRAYGEMIRGHGVQVMIGTNCVMEERTPGNLKISFTRYQPAPKPDP